MPFQEALNVVETEKGPKLEVNVNAFANKENELGESIKYTLNRAQDELDRMSDYMETKLNKDELRVANLVIERELENSIPSKFKDAYKNAETWKEAVDLVTEHILKNIQDFIVSRMKKVIEIVDDESWTSSLSKGEIKDILQNINPNITDKEIDSLVRLSMGENLLEEGGKAIAGGRLARIDNAIKEATR